MFVLLGWVGGWLCGLIESIERARLFCWFFVSGLTHCRPLAQNCVSSSLFSSLALTNNSFKEFMDRNGRFISQADADARVADMQRVRAALMERLDEERRLEQQLKAELAAAHEQDIQDGNQHVVVVNNKKGKKKHPKTHKKVASTSTPTSDDDTTSTAAATTAIHATSSRNE